MKMISLRSLLFKQIGFLAAVLLCTTSHASLFEDHGDNTPESLYARALQAPDSLRDNSEAYHRFIELVGNGQLEFPMKPGDLLFPSLEDIQDLESLDRCGQAILELYSRHNLILSGDVISKLRAQGENPYALFALAYGITQQFINGDCSKQKVQEINPLLLFQKAADKGLKAGAFYRLKFLPYLIDDWENRQDTFAALEAAARDGCGFSNGALAQHYERKSDRDDSDENLQSAFGYYKRAQEIDHHAFMMHIVGMHYYEGRGVDQDQEKARRFLLEAAHRGSYMSQNQLSYFYLNGECGLKKSNDKARAWLECAAQNGSFDARFELGKVYLEQDERRDEGLEMITSAATEGLIDAQLYLAEHHKANPEKFLYWSIMGGQVRDLIRKKKFRVSENAERNSESSVEVRAFKYQLKQLMKHAVAVRDQVEETLKIDLIQDAFTQQVNEIEQLLKVAERLHDPYFMITYFDLNQTGVVSDGTTSLVRRYEIVDQVYWSLGDDNNQASQTVIRLFDQEIKSPLEGIATLLLNFGDTHQALSKSTATLAQSFVNERAKLIEAVLDALPYRNYAFYRTITP